MHRSYQFEAANSEYDDWYEEDAEDIEEAGEFGFDQTAPGNLFNLPMFSSGGGQDEDNAGNWLQEEARFAAAHASQKPKHARSQIQWNFGSAGATIPASANPGDRLAIPAGCVSVSSCVPRELHHIFPFPFFNKIQSGAYGEPS